EWVHVQLHQQKGMISLSPPTICNSAKKNNNQLPYVLNTPIESLIDNVRSWHEADQITGLEIRCERSIVIRTLRITLLSDSGYALTGYEY
ncbi:hypothetical protein ACHWFP_27825, partial [Klebsiella pneumoniae]